MISVANLVEVEFLEVSELRRLLGGFKIFLKIDIKICIFVPFRGDLD